MQGTNALPPRCYTSQYQSSCSIWDYIEFTTNCNICESLLKQRDGAEYHTGKMGTRTQYPALKMRNDKTWRVNLCDCIGSFYFPKTVFQGSTFFFYPGGEDTTRFLTKTAAALPKTIMKNKISSKILSTCVFAAALGYAVSQEKTRSLSYPLSGEQTCFALNLPIISLSENVMFPYWQWHQ